MKAAVEYDVFLPVFTAEGKRVRAEVLRQMRKDLLERFGGLTLFRQRNLGLWKFGRYVYQDEIVILRVVADSAVKGRSYFKRAKKTLEKKLGQRTILIIERRITIV